MELIKIVILKHNVSKLKQKKQNMMQTLNLVVENK
jgi:hypothetical protein